jgi:chromosome condensin MukBEF MukE localization factor
LCTVIASENEGKLLLSELQLKCQAIFRYFRKKGLNSTMTLDPAQFSIINTLKRLGFNLKAIGEKGKPDLELTRDPSDVKMMRALAY